MIHIAIGYYDDGSGVYILGATTNMEVATQLIGEAVMDDAFVTSGMTFDIVNTDENYDKPIAIKSK